MNPASLSLSRTDFFRNLPRHIFFAIVFGAAAAPALLWLSAIELPGNWNLLMAIPCGAIYANAAVLPIAVPGRHWSFGFVAALLMFLLFIAGGILSSKVDFARGPAPISAQANLIGILAVLTGACLGTLYGLLSGRGSAMALGAAIGAACGYAVGVTSLELGDAGALRCALAGAAALGSLHAGACLGAALGAGVVKSGRAARGGEKPPGA
jgi:hypothetical protein